MFHGFCLTLFAAAASPLQRTQHNALYKVLLEKGVGKDNRQRGKYDHGIF